MVLPVAKSSFGGWVSVTLPIVLTYYGWKRYKDMTLGQRHGFGTRPGTDDSSLVTGSRGGNGVATLLQCFDRAGQSLRSHQDVVSVIGRNDEQAHLRRGQQIAQVGQDTHHSEVQRPGYLKPAPAGLNLRARSRRCHVLPAHHG